MLFHDIRIHTANNWCEENFIVYEMFGPGAYVTNTNEC